MDYILVYSDKCNFSNQLKKYNIFNNLNKIIINTKNDLNKIPPYIKEVPILIIKNEKDKSLSILKKNDLLKWFEINSNNNIKTNQKENNDIEESNNLVSSFSNNYSFIGGENNYAENYYSNLNNEINDNISNNNELDINTVSNMKDQKLKDLNNDYESLLEQRNLEFKSINRT